MTKVVNLLGGPGVGKSTLAAALFAEMKQRGLSVELVREYVKNWAWDGIKVGPYDQLYLFAKQARAESRLYGKVDYVVTDSPLLMCPVYELLYQPAEIVKPSVLRFLEYSNSTGVEHLNFLLSRDKPYVQDGRYEDEAGAKKVDLALDWFLRANHIPFSDLGSPRVVEAIVDSIL